MEGHLGQALDQVADGVACSNWNGALHHHGLWLANRADLLKRPSNIPGNGKHILQVRTAIFIAWGANADEDRLCILIGSLLVERKMNASGLNIARQHLREARLIDRAFAALELFNLARINIKAGHLIASLRKARASDESNVSSSDHGEFHNAFDSVCVFRCVVAKGENGSRAGEFTSATRASKASNANLMCSMAPSGRASPAYPPSQPPEPTTRWQGTTIGIGLRRMACPAARAALGLPAAAASHA